jgi:hypothetical protein
MLECPECDARLTNGECKKCGWKLAQPSPSLARPNFGIYREVPDRPRPVPGPLDPEIKAMLAKLKSQFEVVAPAVRAKAVEGFKRCPACETGTFLHLSVRFCRTCYGAL